MKLKTQTFILSMALMSIGTVVISSCKKGNLAPIVIMSRPLGDTMISVGDTLSITGTVTDDESLHEMSVVMLKSTGDTIFKDYPYVHDLKTYSFQYYFLPSVSSTYTLHVTAEDHMSAKTEKTVSIMVM